MLSGEKKNLNRNDYILYSGLMIKYFITVLVFTIISCLNGVSYNSCRLFECEMLYGFDAFFPILFRHFLTLFIPFLIFYILAFAFARFIVDFKSKNKHFIFKYILGVIVALIIFMVIYLIIKV